MTQGTNFCLRKAPQNPAKPQGKNGSVGGGIPLEQTSRSSAFSIPVDLVGGSFRRWPSAARIDPDLRREILDAEIGGIEKSASEATK
jgi:hypothetical protein